MPIVQENAPGILPSRSISLGSRISTITTSLSTPLRYAAMASAALTVSISALASSIIALMPRVMVWGINYPPTLTSSCPGRSAARSPCEAVRCRAGAVANSAVWYGPGFSRSGMKNAAPRPGQVLPHQLPHGAFQTLDRDRVHALGKQPADDSGRFRIVPVPLRHRIEPDGVRIGAGDALQPDRAGLLVDVLDRAARHHDLVRRHRGVADEYHLVVVRIFMQHVPGRCAVGKAALVLLPDAFIEAIVEVEIFHVLEFALRRRE